MRVVEALSQGQGVLHAAQVFPAPSRQILIPAQYTHNNIIREASMFVRKSLHIKVCLDLQRSQDFGEWGLEKITSVMGHYSCTINAKKGILSDSLVLSSLCTLISKSKLFIKYWEGTD